MRWAVFFRRHGNLMWILHGLFSSECGAQAAADWFVHDLPGHETRVEQRP